MSDHVIRCSSLTKRFDDILAVDRVNLDVHSGEIVALLGASGCGKTTILRLIAGLEYPSDGQVEIGGEIVSDARGVRPPDRRGLGMVVQEYALFPHMTVAANVAFGLSALPRDERDTRVREALSLVRLDELGKRYPHELSGGQQQRVALARTLAPNPVAVLLDEPFSNLDTAMRQRLRVEVDEILRARSAAAILVTHDREEAFAVADRVGVMIDGQLLQIDAPEQVYHYPATPGVAALTGPCDFIPATVRRGGCVDTELGTLRVESRAGCLSEGEPAVALLRSDDMDLVPDTNGQGRVVTREFRGDYASLEVELDSGTRIRSRTRSYSTIPVGARVRVSPSKTRSFAAYPANAADETR